MEEAARKDLKIRNVKYTQSLIGEKTNSNFIMQNKKLKLALQANAAFSMLSGLGMLIFHSFIAQWMGITNAKVLLIIGLGLVLFSFSLIRTARQQPISKKQVHIIIWQDWLWVIGSALIILTQSFGLLTSGYILIGIVAVIVADFAILQKRFLT